MEKISQISLKQSVGGSESHVPCAQAPNIPIDFAGRQTDRRTVGRTDVFQKVLFRLSEQEYIHMFIPILIISQISPPYKQT